MSRKPPTLPAIYSQIVMRMAMEHSSVLRLTAADRDALFAELRIPTGLLMGTVTRIPIDRHHALIRKLLDMTEKAGGRTGGMGYEMGLRLGLSTHGVVGIAAMSQQDVRSAIELMMRFSWLVLPTLRLKLLVEEDTAILDVQTDPPVPEDLRRYFHDMALVGLWRSGAPLAGEASADIELCFDGPEPDYYAHYRHRLPRCHFNMGANQICFPARHLGRKVATGDPITAEALEEQCRRQLALLGDERDVVGVVKAILAGAHGSYPDLEAISAQLFMSKRTLNRRLQQSGTSFLQLLNEVRLDEAVRLLKDSTFTIERISTLLGYVDPANFTHAFRKLTGMSPSAYREKP